MAVSVKGVGPANGSHVRGADQGPELQTLRIELALGPREETILKVARELPTDLLIFAWSGVLRANRARTLCTVSALRCDWQAATAVIVKR